MHVELGLHQCAGLLGQPGAQRPVVEQPAQSGGQTDRVGRRHKQAGSPVLHHLGDAGDRCRDTRRAERHRLQQHRGQTVPVAVLPDDAGRREDRRLRHDAPDLALR